jgi:hypothetical protein
MELDQHQLELLDGPSTSSASTTCWQNCTGTPAS